MSLAFAGIFSGMDSDALVEASMMAARGPLNRLEAKKAQYQAKQSALSDLESRVTHLKDLVDELRVARQLRLGLAQASDRDVLSASASGAVSEGSYTVEVNQLAKAEKHVHAGLAALDSVVGAGQFVYTYDGQTRTLQTTAETTLEGLRDLINNDAGNPGVSASLLEYEVDADHVFHLVLTGADSGSDYTITIGAATTLSGFAPGPANWTETQPAQDAQVRVDGYPPGDWIAKSSNTISDIIPGVALTLAGEGTATVTVSRDTSKIKTDLANLAAIYNGIVDRVAAYAGYNQETETGGIMQGDSMLNIFVQQIRSALVGAVPGFQAGTDTFTLVSDIGLEIDREGHLSLDEDVLDDALAEDYQAVLNLIGAAAVGATDDDGLQFSFAAETTQAGTYTVKVDYDASGDPVNAWIKLVGESDAAYRTAYIDGDTISAASDQPEDGMLLTVVAGGTSETITYEVRVFRGFAGVTYNLADAMLDSVDGTLTMKRNQFGSAIDAVNRQIEMQQDRLERKEELLREKYARLETLLAQMDANRGAFEAMFQSVEANNQQIASSRQ